MMPTWQAIVAEKRRERDAKIPAAWKLQRADEYFHRINVMDVPVTCGLLNDLEREITSDYDATSLLEKLKSGHFSAEQVTVAFCKRAAIAQQLTNCLTEICFDEAIERARQLDQERKSTPAGHTLRPLHGLPVSLKDSFQIPGTDCSTGLVCFVNDPSSEYSAIAKLLIDLGAILYCKTNVPQTMMTADSDNNVFGRTLNPHNASLTAGGSTGGEGALIALRGSILGVGTDIAGSVRIPAACCGIYSFKPSSGIFPYSGQRSFGVPGMKGIQACAAPMATSFRDCQMMLSLIMQAPTWKYDHTVLSLPWVGNTSKGKLRIGVVQDDGMRTPTPPQRRILRQATEALEQAEEITVVPITLPNVEEHYKSLWDFFSLAGGQPYHKLLQKTGEPIVPAMEAQGLFSMREKSIEELFALNVKRDEAAKIYQQLFRDNELDAILTLAAPHTATPFNSWLEVNYTGLWNFLDFPACIIPVDRVREFDHKDAAENAKYGPEDQKQYRLYSGPEGYMHAPLVVQLVGYRHMDESLAATATRLDSIFNGARQ